MNKMIPAAVLAVSFTGAPVAGALDIRVSTEQLQALGVESRAASSVTEAALGVVPVRLVLPATHTHAVITPVGGVVSRLHVQEGDSVRAGQPLLRINSRELATLTADIARLTAETEMLHMRLRRDEALVREGLAPRRRLEESRAEYRARETALREKRTLMGRLQPVEGSQTEIELLAPVAGRAVENGLRVGAAVSAESTALFIVDSAALWGEAQVPEALIARLHPGQRATVGPVQVGATVIAVGLQLDPSTRSALARLEIPDPRGLIAGQTLEATLYDAAAPGTLLLPAPAVTRLGDASVIFLRTATGFRTLEVRPGARIGDEVVVQAPPLDTGAQIAISGVSALKSIAVSE